MISTPYQRICNGRPKISVLIRNGSVGGWIGIIEILYQGAAKPTYGAPTPGVLICGAVVIVRRTRGAVKEVLPDFFRQLFVDDRQREAEGAAEAWPIAFGPDPAAMRMDDLLADRQPQAGA